MSLKEKYNLLKKKYSLPEFDVLNQDFDIEDIDSESVLILSKVRGKMYDKIEYFSKLIESFLQPDTNLASLYEVHYITDEQREKAYTLFKKLVRVMRHSSLVAIENNEEEIADFIKKTYLEWSLLKQDLKKHLTKIETLWKKETDIKEELSYFG